MIVPQKGPLISIVIPIYQVGKYLEKCLSSVINQTYRNLEILLIDDGSLDESPAICDMYQSQDCRIVVVHQKNGGLSHARNVGLALAKGDFIGFVDGDDWIEPNMYEVLLNACQESNVDISACRPCFESDDFQYKSNTNDNSGERVIYSCEEGLKRLVPKDGIVHYSVCNKLYRKKVLEGVGFAEGKIFEDMFWMPQILCNVQSIVCIDAFLYHYRQRTDSLSHDDKLVAKGLLDKVEMACQRNEYLFERHPTLQKLLILDTMEKCYLGYRQIDVQFKYLDTDGSIRQKLHQIFCGFGMHWLLEFDSGKARFVRILFFFCPWLLGVFYNIWGKLRGRFRGRKP